jgi:hypothetical protein
MGDDAEDEKSWYQTLPGFMTGLAAILTAVTGLIATMVGFLPKFFAPTVAPDAQDCIPGYVWRLAHREDRVCVAIETHLRALQDNELAGSRRKPAGGAYGPDTCLDGFVWRDAFPGDRVCVLVPTRTQAAEDNAQAAIRIKR